MPRFVSDEQLLGYLLGKLDSEEHAIVSEAVSTDEFIQQRLRILQGLPDAMIEPMAEIEPPANLVERLMDRIESAEANLPLAGTQEIANSDWNFQGPPKDPSLLEVRRPWRRFESADSMSLISDWNHPEFRNWIDAIVIGIAAAVFLSLIGPSIQRSRESARADGCANALAEVGGYMRDFALRNRNQTVPEVELYGPLAFAGSYALKLRDAEYLTDGSSLWCPAGVVRRVLRTGDTRLPTTEDFLRLPEVEQRTWRQTAGGSYAYSLGMIVDESHTMPSLDSPTKHAILADAPLRLDEQNMSFAVHFGDAANVLYDDGHVELLRLDLPLGVEDHPLLNREGKMEAGLDEDDSALGSSFISPLGTLR
jgi:hypothetical protein